MKANLTIGLATAIASALALVPALGQEVESTGDARIDALTMTCADLAGLDATMGAGIIHYLAGYSDGQLAMLAASGPADAAAGSTEGAAAEDDSGATGAEMSAGGAPESIGAAGGLGISVEEVITACAESPDSPASEVIKVARGAAQQEIDPQDEDPAAEGEDGQDVGSGNAVVE